MKLYHATPKSNLDSIRQHGLDPSRANGKVKGVWLHTQSKQSWAILHTMKRHACGIDDVVLLEVNLSRAALSRRWRGLWTCAEKIHEFTVIEASEIAESPINENGA